AVLRSDRPWDRGQPRLLRGVPGGGVSRAAAEGHRMTVTRVRVHIGVGIAAAAALAGAAGCGASPITAVRFENAIQPAFGNLVDLQVSRLGLPPLPAPDFAVTAICRRQTGADSGSGDWSCAMVWQGPDRRTLRDTYDLFVGTDGCYTATASGENLGGPT